MHLRKIKKYYQTLFLILFFLLTAYSLQLNATVRFVSKTGSSIPPYLTWETAADSIQKCINICVFGDTIYVANGVYQEQVVMIPGLSLIGSGADSTIINTQALVNSNGFVAVEVKDNCLFKGFQIIVYYNVEKGFGIAQNGNSLVEENTISKASYGIYVGYTGTNVPVVYKNSIYNVSKGIDIFNSNVLVRNNSIYTDPNSSAAVVAGIRISAFTNSYTPVIDSNYIVNGSIQGYGITMDLGSSPTITNNIIKIVRSDFGINSGIGGNTKISNNSIIGEAGYDGIYKNGSNVQAHNNFVYGTFSHYGIFLGPNDTLKNSIVIGATK